jgi:hypothetical protein
MGFNIKAEKPVSGIIISPDSKTYSFTDVTNGTVVTPRRVSGNYLVVFSGATIETETRYSLGIGIEADGYFGGFTQTGRYEPNNTESATVSLSEQKIMAYLYKNAIDYYRVSYGNFNVPPTPTNVSASVADAQVRVSWNAVTGAQSYNVYRADSQTEAYTKVGASTTASYTETVARVGTYYYKISAVSADGFESAYSTPTAVAVAGPATPTNVTASAAGAQVTVSWSAVTEVSSYNIYRSISQTGTYTKVGTSASSPYTETVGAMGTYYYEVSAVSAGGLESGHSTPASVMVIMLNNDVTDLSETLAWLSANAVNSTHYTLSLTRDETISAQLLSYSGMDVTVTLKGKGGEKIVSLSGNGSLFTIESGATLVLDSGVTLKGHSSNNASLVRVNSGGNLVLKDGGTISGNTTSSYYGGGVFVEGGGTISGNTAVGYTHGGGVYVEGGTFTMSGGEISGNTASSSSPSFSSPSFSSPSFSFSSPSFSFSSPSFSFSYYPFSYGGGVYVYSGGTFTKQSGGIIYGSNATSALKNTAYSDSYGHAVYVRISESSGKKRNTTGGVGGTLDSTKSGSAGGWE